MTAHEAAVVDTSIIAALKLYDQSELPDTILITAVTQVRQTFPRLLRPRPPPWSWLRQARLISTTM